MAPIYFEELDRGTEFYAPQITRLRPRLRGDLLRLGGTLARTISPSIETG